MTTQNHSGSLSRRLTQGRFPRTKATACALAAALFATIGAAAAPSTANANASDHCYVWTYAHTMKKLRVALLDSHVRLKWCADQNRRLITVFEVEAPYALVRNTAWLRNPGKQDVRPTNPLGQGYLHISADFSAYPTTKGAIVGLRGRGASGELTWVPGAIGDHIEADLWPDGRITGSTWSG